MDINATVDNLLDLIKIHSFEESVPGFILSIKTLLMLEEQNHIPTTNLVTSGYHAIFGIAALATPYIPDNIIGIMALQKAEELRRSINRGNGKAFYDGIKASAQSGLFLYEEEQYLDLANIKELQ